MEISFDDTSFNNSIDISVIVALLITCEDGPINDTGVHQQRAEQKLSELEAPFSSQIYNALLVFIDAKIENIQTMHSILGFHMWAPLFGYPGSATDI